MHISSKKTVNKDNREKIIKSCLNSDHFRLTECDSCFLEYLSHASKLSCEHEKLGNGTYILCKPCNIFAANKILCQCESLCKDKYCNTKKCTHFHSNLKTEMKPFSIALAIIKNNTSQGPKSYAEFKNLMRVVS